MMALSIGTRWSSASTRNVWKGPDISHQEVSPTDLARLERAATLTERWVGRALTG